MSTARDTVKRLEWSNLTGAFWVYARRIQDNNGHPITIPTPQFGQRGELAAMLQLEAETLITTNHHAQRRTTEINLTPHGWNVARALGA